MPRPIAPQPLTGDSPRDLRTSVAQSLNRPCLHEQNLRIYFEDTDAGGIVYHASWLRFFERARTDWLRSMGIAQSQLALDHGIGFVVRDMSIGYLRPARLDDLVRTELRLLDVRGASISLAQHAVHADTRASLVEAKVRIAVMRLDDGRPAPLPSALRERISATAATATR